MPVQYVIYVEIEIRVAFCFDPMFDCLKLTVLEIYNKCIPIFPKLSCRQLAKDYWYTTLIYLHKKEPSQYQQVFILA